MRELISLARRIVGLLMLVVALMGGKAKAPPAMPAPAPSAAAAVPAAPGTPHCTYSMAVKADGTKRWIGVCIVYGQTTRLPGDYPTAKAARDAVLAFQQAWRDARGTPA
jgi:hypothetical protein